MLRSGLVWFIQYSRSNAGLGFLAGFFIATVFSPGLLAMILHPTSPLPLSQSVLTNPGQERVVDAPARLLIPRLGINTTFTTSVGVDHTGALEVPKVFNQVAWYHFGPAPGEVGPAVVVGHVNSYLGPAIFDRLWELRVGELIVVETAAGREYTFRVSATKEFEQADFPTALVYGDLDYPGLRLITCSGVFDETGTGFTHNTVVFAELAESSRPSL